MKKSKFKTFIFRKKELITPKYILIMRKLNSSLAPHLELWIVISLNFLKILYQKFLEKSNFQIFKWYSGLDLNQHQAIISRPFLPLNYQSIVAAHHGLSHAREALSAELYERHKIVISCSSNSIQPFLNTHLTLVRTQ